MADGRLVIVCSGGDWNDASFSTIKADSTLDMKAACGWYKDWLKLLPPSGKERSDAYRTFPEWLVDNKLAECAHVEEFWDE